MVKTLYFNIEDDVKSIVARLRQEPGSEFVLVFPRRCYLFADPVNAKLLKKQLDILNKNAAVMTMDERGQAASREAGFELRELPTRKAGSGMSDVATARPPKAAPVEPVLSEPEEEVRDTEEAPAPVRPAAIAVKRTTTVRPLPQVAVHDTIFSDIPKRSSFQAAEAQARSARQKQRKTVWLGAVALVILIVFLLSAFVLPKAEVVVYAKAEDITRDLEIASATTISQPDVNTLSLPAYTVEKTVDIQDKFESAGKKEVGSKAQGKVRVFNLTGASINLRASTTTLSAKDRKYVFPTDQNYIKAVPAKNISNPSAGHVADVVASEGGELSNMPVGTRLEIQNQVFGSNPQLLYAVVEEEIRGGNSRFITTVEQSDITKAQADLTSLAVAQVTSELKEQGRYLAERAFEAEVVNFTSDKVAGTESTTFNAQLTVRIRGLAFDPEALTGLVRDRVSQVLPAGTKLEPAEKDLMSFRVRELNIPSGNLRLIVHLESRLYKDVDTTSFRADITGMSKAEAEQVLLEKQNVAKVDIVLWPSWQGSIPRVTGRIHLTEKVE